MKHEHSVLVYDNCFAWLIYLTSIVPFICRQESLRRVLQEKLEAVRKLSDLVVRHVYSCCLFN